MYTVIIVNQYGNEEVSRYFNTIKAARKWTKRLCKSFKAWISDSHGNEVK